MSEYYVHRKGTFVGNAPSFWAKGGNGYTCYVLGAERFSEEEAIKLYKSDKNKWEILKCEEVDKRLHLVFDYQDKKRLGTDEPCGWNSGYASFNSDQQQHLALKDLEIMQLREALNAMRDAFDVGGDVTSEENNALYKADNALSTPTTYANLMAWHNEQLGEPVAWMNSANGVVINKTKKQLALYSLFDIPLYAKKG